MRWLLLTATVFALVLCFTRHGSVALACWLFIAIIGIFATALAFAQARIAGSSRGDTLSEYELRQLREGKTLLNHDRSTSKR